MSKLFTALRIFMTVLFFYILFRKFVELGDVGSDFGKINIVYIIPGFGLVLFTHILTTFRWKVVCRSYKDIGFKRAFLLYLEGIFYASVTPGRLGEFMRGLMYAKEKQLRKGEGFATVILERLFDLIVPFLIVIGYLVSYNWIIMLVISFVFSVPAYMVSVYMVARLKRYIPFVKHLVIKRLPFSDILIAGALSTSRWFLHSILFALVLRALGITGIPFPFLAMAVNITALSLFLPITVNGWGLREALWIYLLAGFTDRSSALVASVTFALVSTYFLAFIGAISMLLQGKRKVPHNSD